MRLSISGSSSRCVWCTSARASLLRLSQYHETSPCVLLWFQNPPSIAICDLETANLGLVSYYFSLGYDASLQLTNRALRQHEEGSDAYVVRMTLVLEPGKPRYTPTLAILCDALRYCRAECRVQYMQPRTHPIARSGECSQPTLCDRPPLVVTHNAFGVEGCDDALLSNLITDFQTLPERYAPLFATFKVEKAIIAALADTEHRAGIELILTKASVYRERSVFLCEHRSEQTPHSSPNSKGKKNFLNMSIRRSGNLAHQPPRCEGAEPSRNPPPTLPNSSPLCHDHHTPRQADRLRAFKDAFSPCLDIPKWRSQLWYYLIIAFLQHCDNQRERLVTIVVKRSGADDAESGVRWLAGIAALVVKVRPHTAGGALPSPLLWRVQQHKSTVEVALNSILDAMDLRDLTRDVPEVVDEPDSSLSDMLRALGEISEIPADAGAACACGWMRCG